ncbi:MAG: glycoside hydrolase family 3 C-terminal domain-containing protein [Candidatus Marinimicrobia bacterium]|nr:glycoside hydrolase family 3 C-terminal domain-containing protein [Candidatus Neomarinimicrobiota bacterium]
MRSKFLVIINLVFGFLLSCSSTQTAKVDIEAKISAMTLEEKIEFIGGYKQFNIMPVERLGIPEIHFADGPVGVRNFGKSTAYPASITLAASFDRKLAGQVGKAIGSESRAQNCHVMLGPAMNIYRMPLCGRNFEYLGEDPYLAGQMAKEYTLGMQKEGVVACAKHYAANNQEFNRHHCSSDMNERTLHEIYLPAFKATVQEGNVGAIMTSYNLINGIHASEHHYLNNEILKEKWGFDGFIMSDWVSTYDGLACAKGGLDLEMPSGAMMNKETLIPAIESGALDESVIDDKIRRILKTYVEFGYFENPDISKGYVLDEKFARKTALEAARGGMVLLKNADNTLPLQKEKLKKIALIGPNGNPVVSGGGGSSYTDPLHPMSLKEAVEKVAGENVAVVFEKGIFTGATLPEGIFDENKFYYYENSQKVPGVKADYYLGKKLEGDIILSTAYEKLDLTDSDMWDEEAIPSEDYSARFTCCFTPEKSGAYTLAGKGDDGYKIFLDGIEIVSMWRDQGPTVGKKEQFLNAGQEYNLELQFYQNGGGAVIQLGLAEAIVEMKPEEYSEKALAAAHEADVVILAVGFNPGKESEGFDRTFEMPYNQSEFINKIAKVNDNIIVVLNAGGNVEMASWIDKADALLLAWYPGQEGNLAAAEILFGLTNPSGKLPASFAKTMEENPCYNSYFDHDEDLKVFYQEGIFMGYRYWDKAATEPRFPFGFGLSYTTFDYSGIATDKKSYSMDETVTVSVKMKNTGKMDGAEAVQLYVSDKECSLPRPIKELKAFDKVMLKQGEEKTITFELNKNAFAFYNPEKHDWEVEAGEFEILVGSSSVDIREKVTIQIQ